MVRIRFRYAVCIAAMLAVLVPASRSFSGSDPFIGEMIWVPYNFEPRGWAFCDGRLLNIAQNTALFSLLGTTYGGNGTTNFALPDMRDRLMINAGQLEGGALYALGQSGGTATHTLTTNEMPAHSHMLQASTATGSLTSPVNNVFAQPASGTQYGPNPGTSMSPGTLSPTGGGQPHNNMMPYTTLNCIIALQGIYPPRQ